jgi:hypothetical protein
MTLPASGPITFNNVNVELGLTGTTLISLGQASVRTLAAVSSGAIAMSNLYGKSNRVSIAYNISSNSADLSINVASLSGYVAGGSDIVITVNSGIYVYANSTSTPAFTLIGGTSGDTLTLVNNGFIIGKGGAGGDVFGGVPQGYAGGPALSVNFPTTINNTNGAAFIGGGGGGGGAGASEPLYGSNGIISSGGGGGAGGGIGGYGVLVYYFGSTYLASQGAGGGLGSAGGAGGIVSDGGPTGSPQPNDYLYATGGGGGGRVIPGTRQSNIGYAVPGQGGTAGGSGGSGSNALSGYGGGASEAGGNYSGSFPGAAGGGGGWGAAGGIGNGGGAAGGSAVLRNGNTVTFVSNDLTRVYGAVV